MLIGAPRNRDPYAATTRIGPNRPRAVALVTHHAPWDAVEDGLGHDV
jgi:hypothetical protein